MLSVKTESLMIENAYLAEANVQMSPAGRRPQGHSDANGIGTIC